MPARRSGYGQPNLHTRLADDDKLLFVTLVLRVSIHTQGDARPSRDLWLLEYYRESATHQCQHSGGSAVGV
eukprot:358784-Chlamydomonas_euryale.AAC.7